MNIRRLDATNGEVGSPRPETKRMTFGEYRFLVLSDLYRITGNVTLAKLAKHILAGGTFRYIFWMRTCAFTRRTIFLRFAVYPVARLILTRLMYRYGISIPWSTTIGSGFYIGHFGGIVVNSRAKIGKNCNISQGVTVGQVNRGAKRGVPVLGDNVYIGPGAKIVGAIKVGNNVAVGANCVVIADIPDDSVVVGVPGRVVAHDGATGYINRTDYEERIQRRS